MQSSYHVTSTMNDHNQQILLQQQQQVMMSDLAPEHQQQQHHQLPHVQDQQPNLSHSEWVSLMTSMNLGQLCDTQYQYMLSASTTPATKLNEETLTYLNQGQSYELKLKKSGDVMTTDSDVQLMKSLVRVVFHERRLQYSEKEKLTFWKHTRPGERILDIDIPLSYGLLDMKIDPQQLSSLEFIWDPKRDCGIFIKVNCISTEFTEKRHGGEKGVPFRIQVETYSLLPNEQRIVHCASCQVKVFKPKGADRKHKTDRDKLDKRSDAEREKYQPSYEFTVLNEIPLDQVQNYLDHLNKKDGITALSSMACTTSACENYESSAVPQIGSWSTENTLGISSNSLDGSSSGIRDCQSFMDSLSFPDNALVSSSTAALQINCASYSAPMGNHNSAYNNSRIPILNFNPRGPAPSRNFSQITAGLNEDSKKIVFPAAAVMSQTASPRLDGSGFARSPCIKESKTCYFPPAAIVTTTDSCKLDTTGPSRSASMQEVKRVFYPQNPLLPITTVQVAASQPTVGFQQIPPSCSFTGSHASLNSDVDSKKEVSIRPDILLHSSTALQVVRWLHAQRFSHFVDIFESFSGADILRLTREDLIHICGLADGIRLNNALHSKIIRPKLTIYVFQDNLLGMTRLLRCSGGKSGSNSWELSSSTISEAGGLEISAPSNYSQHTINASPRPSISSTLDSPRPQKRSLGVSPQSQNEVETTPEHRFGGCKRLCTKSLELNSLEGYYAVYLEFFTAKHFTERLAALYSISAEQIVDVVCRGSSTGGGSGLNVIVTDSVVRNFQDQSKFGIAAKSDDEQPGKYHVHLRAVAEAA